ncbi:MAG: T9SS type A sorting domain-containing protein, partial [candidate division WOR-3 bacterium]
TLPFELAIGEPVPSDTGYYYAYYSGGLHEYTPEFEWFALAPPGPGLIVTEITNEDADTVTVSLPFTFRYYGTDYNSVGICSNGFLELGSSTYRFGANTGIPASGGPRAMVAPFWDDLDPSLAGDIYQYYDDVNHRWLLEFYDVAHYGATGDRETFQVVFLDPLYYPTPTGDGEIMVYYLTGLAQPGATFGLENAAETVGLEYYYDGVYHAWAAAVTDSFAVLYTTYPPDYLGVEEYGKLSELPLRTMMGVVYPNPFVRDLQVNYQLAVSGRVTVAVYDAAGRLVSALAEGMSEPGYYTVNWRGFDDQGRRVPAGVYFIRLETDEIRQVKKAVLLK